MGTDRDAVAKRLAASTSTLEGVAWTEHGYSVLTAGTEDLDALRRLLDRATIGLAKEDRWLNRAFADSPHGEQYAKRGAPGLAYWIFEHNLVFAIFRDWIKTHRVLWDEQTGAQWRVGSEAVARTRRSSEWDPPDPSGKRFFDLQVLHDDEGSTRTLFEAKWYGTNKARATARDDLAKLERERNGRAAWSGYALLFAYGSEDEVVMAVASASDECSGKVSFVGFFPTTLLKGQAGYFCLLAVRAVSPRDS